MKLFLLLFVFTCSANVKAQKYALLDKRLAQPITYTNKVTSNDQFNGLFPVEKKWLPQFIKDLEEIKNKLSSKGSFEAKQYTLGCTKFTGVKVSLASEDRLDYVITSNCDGVKISMHLCDAKMTNAGNLFFIKTWIKYIGSYVK